jgi:hypothetical protein
MNLLRRGRRHAAQRPGGDPDKLRALRRRTAARIVRATGSRSAAAVSFLVLAIVAWIVADILVGKDPGRTAGSADPPSRAQPPPLPPNEPAAVAAAGPSVEIQAMPTPAPAPTPGTGATTPGPSGTAPTPPGTPSAPPPPVDEPPANPGVAASPKTAYAKQYTLMVRSAPTQRADLVATLPNNTPVTLVCHTTGPSVTSFTGRVTTTWNKITTPDGTTGYVSDGWVLTSDDVTRLVPVC